MARQGDRADLPAGDPDDACRRSSTTTCRSPARSTTAASSRSARRSRAMRAKVMHAIWGLGMLSLTKCVVVVDAHVDVHDYEQVLFYAGANVDPARDVVLSRGAARPPRPRAGAAVRRRQARDRRDREVARGGRAPVAGGDRDEPGDPGARRPPLGRVRHRVGSPCGDRPDSVRLPLVAPTATTLTPVRRGLNPRMRERSTAASLTSRRRPSGRSASPSASPSSSSA